jgi:hypothetical protein
MARYKSAVRVKSAAPTRKKAMVYKSKDGAITLKHSISNKGSHKLEFINLPDEKMIGQINALIRDLDLEEG